MKHIEQVEMVSPAGLVWFDKNKVKKLLTTSGWSLYKGMTLEDVFPKACEETFDDEIVEEDDPENMWRTELDDSEDDEEEEE